MLNSEDNCSCADETEVCFIGAAAIVCIGVSMISGSNPVVLIKYIVFYSEPLGIMIIKLLEGIILILPEF